MDYELRFTDKEITPWGGLGVMKQMLDHMEFEEALADIGLPVQRSGRGYGPVKLVMQFILSIWCGGNRFAHAEVTRFDAVLGKIFGMVKMANFKAIMRLFGKFDRMRNDEVFGHLYRWLFGQLQVDRLTLDLDSTVMTRYGQQQGAAKGYNPTKPGRCSHHPLMAFVSDVRMVANCWLRPGNAGSANNGVAFLATTLEHLGDKRVGLLRADSGFCEAGFLDEVERRRLNYVIALKLNQPLQRALVSATGWWKLDDGIELVSIEYHAHPWSQPRRVVGIRQHVLLKSDAKGKQLSLFAQDETIRNFRYAALVTNLALPDVEVWRCYRGRADCENRIKELKYDFGAQNFCLENSWATEAALQFVMMAFNLMSLFRQAVLRTTVMRNGIAQPVQQTLQTIRHQLLAQPAYLGKDGRKPVIKLALAMQRREWFEGLWNRARVVDLPVAFIPLSPSG